MTFGSGANGCLGHGDNVDVAQVSIYYITCVSISSLILCIVHSAANSCILSSN